MAEHLRWERQQRARGSDEDDEEHKVTCTGRHVDSLTIRSVMEAIAGFEEERGDDGSMRLKRRGGEHHVEREEANPKVATIRTEEHRR